MQKSPTLADAQEEIERVCLAAAMEKYGRYGKVAAAEALGISLKTLYLKLKRHGLTAYVQVQVQAPKRRGKA